MKSSILYTQTRDKMAKLNFIEIWTFYWNIKTEHFVELLNPWSRVANKVFLLLCLPAKIWLLVIFKIF